jgi:hypothetical protein
MKKDVTMVHQTAGIDSGGLMKPVYIDKETALKVAKRLDPNPDTKWDTKFVENQTIEINNQKEIHSVWVVSTIYPAGNKFIVQVDALTGAEISETEIEAGV